MRRQIPYALIGTCAFVLWQVLVPLVHGQQQIVDPDFKAVVEKPAYRRNGPVVAIDEAHSNFHTAGGQYRPFADLLTNDGYTVRASTTKFDKGAFAGIDVLVIANALSANAQSNPGLPAFTEEECDAVRDWVLQGGSLLLISDHAPSGVRLKILANVLAWRWEKDGPLIALLPVASRHNWFFRARTVCWALIPSYEDGTPPKR
jgi:hypothetical protein